MWIVMFKPPILLLSVLMVLWDVPGCVLVAVNNPNIMVTNIGSLNQMVVDIDGLNRYVTKAGSLTMFDLTAANSGNARFTVAYGDGAAFTDCNNGDTVVQGNHTYIDVGNYVIELYITDTSVQVDTAMNVTVTEPVPVDLFLFKASSPTEALEGDTVTFEVVRHASQYLTKSYFLSSCKFKFDSIEYEVSKLETIELTTAFSINLTMTTTGKVVFMCTNVIGSLNINHLINVKPRLYDIKLTIDTSQSGVSPFLLNNIQRVNAKVGSVVRMKFDAPGGEVGLHTYVIDWGDSSIDTVTNTPHANYTKDHIYLAPGRRYPWVEITDVVGTFNASLYWPPGADLVESGLFVWDFCETCLQLDVINPVSAKVYTDGSTDITYKLSVPSSTNPAKTPKLLNCLWQFPSASIIEDPAFTDNVNTTLNYTIVKSYTHTYIPPNPQNVTATCITPLGSHVMTANVSVIVPLTSVNATSLYGDGYHIIANKSSDYMFAVGGASEGVTILVVFDNSFAFVDVCGMQIGPVTYNYTFETAGLHNITIDASDDRYNFTDNLQVLAIAELMPLTLYSNGLQQDTTIVMDPLTNVDFSVIMDHTTNLPIKVACTFDFGDGNITQVPVGELRPGASDAVNISHFYTYIQGDPIKDVIVNCSNPVSNQILNTTVGVYKALSNISLATKQYTELGFNTTFTIAGTGGDLMSHFDIYYGNGISTKHSLPLFGSFEVDYMYDKPGYYSVNLTGYDNAGMHYIEQLVEVVVQKHIDTLVTFDGTKIVAYPSAMTGQYYVTMPTIPADGFVPSEVNCTLTFPRSTESMIVSNMTNWYDLAPINYTLIFEDGEDQIMKVFCFNMVDNFTSELPVHVNRSMANFSVSVADQMNQTAMTSKPGPIYVNCDEPICYVPNNNIMFSLTALYGAGPVMYTFAGNSFTLPQHENTLQQVSESTSTPGLKTRTATALEQIFSSTYTDDVNYMIQLDTSILSTATITGPTSVIVPRSTPVQYQFTIGQSHIISTVNYPPTNASCVFATPAGSGSAQVFSTEVSSSVLSDNMMFNIGDGASQTLEVNCTNKVSHYTKTLQVNMVKRVNNIKVEVNSPWGKYCRTDINCSLDISGNDGQAPINYVLSLTGGFSSFITFYSYSSPLHKNWTYGRIFKTPETLTGTLLLNDSAGVQYFTEYFFVQNPLISANLKLETSSIGVYEDINRLTTHPISLIKLTGLDPTNVSCTWTFPNGTQSLMFASDYNWTDIDLILTLDPSTSLLKTISVFCENEVSNMTKTVTILLKPRIRNILIELVSIWGQYTETNAITSYSITAVNGNYSVINELFPVHSVNSSYKVDFAQDPFANHTMTHNYNLPGVYTVGLIITDLVGDINVNPIVVYVEQRLQTINLIVDLKPGVTYATWGPPLVAVFWVTRANLNAALLPSVNVDFTLTHTRGANTLTEPTNVTCDWTHTAGTEVQMLFTFESGATAKSMAPITELPGYHTTSVNCSNHVSNLQDSVQYIIMEKIAGLKLTADKYIAGISDVFTFTVERTSGNNVTYVLDYKDSSNDNRFNENDYSPALFTHAYTAQGHYNVTVTASNPAGDSVSEQVSPVYFIDVQLILAKLTLHAVTTSTPQIINPFQIPSGDANLKILPDLTYGIPLTVYFDWNFGDSTTFIGDKPPPTWTDHFHIKKYTTASIGQVPVSVRAYNNISEQTDGLSINITLIETITGLKLTSDKRYVKPQETVTFTAKTTTGSHIHYSITYSDGLSDSTAYDYTKVFQPDVLNRQQVFQHSYVNTGNYTVTVTATNHFSTKTDTLVYQITVQYPVPDLNVTGLTPVLTPPGQMSFNLSRTDGQTFIPNDVTCNWTYNGILGDSFYYFPNWNLPETIAYHYNPNRWTITPTVKLDVSCSNWVTPIPKTTSMVVDIIDHLVIFKNLKDNGPVQYNESITWTLDINLYGHNPCFLWTFTNTSLKVLFGRLECKNLTEYIGSFNDFVPSTTSDTQLSYTTSYNIGPIVEVVVEAENSISANDTLSDLALVLEKPCDPPYASVGQEGKTPEQPRKIYFSQPATVHGVTTTNCSYTHSFDVKWDVYQYDNTPTIFGVHKIRKTLFKGGISLKPDYTIPPKSLPMGLYYLDFISTMKGLPLDIISEDSMYLQVTPSPLQTGITGGVNRDISAMSGENTVVDTWSLSIDPDLVDPTNKANMTWKWQCTKVSVSDPPALSSTYDWNNNTGIDKGDCGINSVSVPSEGKIQIPGSDLVANQKYRLTVHLSKLDGRTATAMQVVTAKVTKVMELNIKCVRNCDFWINPDSSSRLAGECVTCSGSEQIVYTWKYEMKNDTGTYSVATINPAPVSVAVDGTNSMLEIKSYSLKRGYFFRVTLNGVDSSSGLTGSMSKEFRVNKGPFDGSCTSTQPVGTAGLTKMSITCNGWKDYEESNLLKKTRRKRQAFVNAPNLGFGMQANMSYVAGPTNMLLSYGRDPVSAPTYLPLGDPSNNYTTPFYVTVTDSMGTSSFVNVIVRSIVPDNVVSNMTFYLYLLELKKIADAGDIQSTTQMIWTLLTLHEEAGLPTTLDLSNEPDKKLKLYGGPGVDMTQFNNIQTLVATGYYILQMEKLNSNFPNELKQIAELLQKLTTSVEALNSVSDPKIGLNIIKKAVVNLELFSSAMTAEQLLSLSTDLLKAMGNLLDLASTVSSSLLDTDCTFTTCQPGTIGNITDLSENLMVIANNAMDTISKLLARDMMPGEQALIIDAGLMVLVVQRMRKGSLAGLRIATKYAVMQLPFNETVYDDVTASCVDVNYAAFKTNPYTWDIGRKNLNAPSQQARIFNCDTREIQPLQNTTYDDSYKLEHVFTNPVANWTVTELGDISKDLAYHRFWMNDSSTYAQLYFDTQKYKDMSLELYVIYQDDPNINKFDFKTVLPRGMPDPIPADKTLRREYIVNATGNYTDGLYTYVIPKHWTKKLGLYTVGVLAKAYNPDGSAMMRVNYTFYVQYVACKLWHADLNSWTDEDCELEQESTLTRVKFRSKVFPSSFGAGVLVGPNTINFGTVFDNGLAKLLENIHVLVTIVLFILIYLSLLPYAYKHDKIDRLNWTPFPIVAYIPSHDYTYEVEVYTGRMTNAGTTSDVYIVIAGKGGDTGVMQLTCKERQNFVTGSVNKFTISSKVYLEKVFCVRVYHDNSGKGKKMDWFLEKIVITDKLDDKKYLFLCDKWLSIDRGDFKCERTLKLVSKYQYFQFTGMFKRRAITSVIEDNLWISTLMRRNENHFTRVQRASAAIALVFLAMISNAMWYGKGDSNKPQAGIQIGPISFTLQSLMVSIYAILTVLPATLIILLLFMKSKRRKHKLHSEKPKGQDDTPSPVNSAKLGSKSQTVADIEIDLNQNNNNNSSQSSQVAMIEEHPPKKKKKRGIDFSGQFLPFWCVYIAFFLCFAAVVLSGFFTILYSFEWGGAKSSQWLAAFCLTFLESEGIVSPLKAIMLAILISILCKKPVDETDEYADEYDEFVFDEDDETDKMADEEMAKLRYKRWLMDQLQIACKALIWHVLFMICLILVVYGNRDPNSYLSNEELKRLFFDDAAEVSTQADFWDYLKDSAFPNLFLEEKDNGVAVGKQGLEFVINHNSIRLGPPAVRQFRVKKNACKAVTHLIDITCNVEYGGNLNEDANFLPKWIYTPVNYTWPPSNKLGLKQAFMYDTGDPTNFDYWGIFGSFSGRGYAYPLGVTHQEAVTTVDNLISEMWLDRYTRGVVFEINVYNANVNLFSLVSILFEFPTFGAALITHDIKTVKLYRYIGGMGLLALLTEAVIIIFIIALIIKMIVSIVKTKKAFFKSIWNWMEILKLVCGLGSIALYVLRTLMIQSTITEMMNNRGKLISFRGITLVDEVFVYLLGLALFLQILQLLWVFKFNKSLGILGGTLKYSFSDLVAFFVVVWILFMAFAFLHFIYYGRFLWDYRDFLHTSYAQLNLMLGAFRTGDFESITGMFGRIIFVGYMLAMVFLYMNMMVAIIMDVYAGVNDGEYDLGEEYKAMDLLTKAMKVKSHSDDE